MFGNLESILIPLKKPKRFWKPFGLGVILNYFIIKLFLKEIRQKTYEQILKNPKGFGNLSG
jgi:hypothetical protein